MNISPGRTIAFSVLLIFVSGCSSTSAVKNLFAGLTPSTQDSDDPLAVVPGKISDEYKTAKHELSAPETTLLRFARWREDMGDHVEAMNRYREIIKANDQCVPARLGIARIEQATGRTDAAKKILDATAQRHPERSDVWIAIGKLQSSQNNYIAAIDSLNRAVDLNSKDQAARYELGLAYARSGQVDKAQPHLAYAVGASAASFNIGFVLNEMGRKAEAAQWAERAIANHPDERTLKASRKMLASLRSGSSGTMMAKRKIPSKVNVELTSYEAYRETPEIAVEPRRTKSQIQVEPKSRRTAAPTTRPSNSPFRTANQSRIIEDPQRGLRSAMAALEGQRNHHSEASMPSQNMTGRARVDSVPNWNGPSAAPAAGPIIQNRSGSSQSSLVEPQAW